MNARKWQASLACFLLALSIAPDAWSQVVPVPESEPNDPCNSPQDVGDASTLPFVVAGELLLDFGSDPPGDVDFYRYTAAPGTVLRAGLRGAASGAGTLYGAYLGVFDSSCELLAENSQYQGPEPKINFQVPADGIFILAVAGCCDFQGYSWNEGTYVLRLANPPVPVAEIAGRVVDAVTGEPLPGNTFPYAHVTLYRELTASGLYYIADAQTDDAGNFRFVTDQQGNPLDPSAFSAFRLEIWANDYELAQFGPFPAAQGESVNVGDIALQPPPIAFANIAPCADIPPEGGTCRYSVVLRNNTLEPLYGLSWSLVYSYGPGTPWGYSVFQSQGGKPAKVEPVSTRSLDFSFKVPADVAEGTSICPEVWVSDRATDYFGTLRAAPLFCIMKQYGAFSVMSADPAAGRVQPRGLGTMQHR